MAAKRGSLEFVIQDLTRFTERAAVGLTLEVTGRLIETTPVDLGWARANWIPSLGEANTTPAGERPGDAGGVDSSKQQAAIGSVITGYRLSIGALWITNNVPYILPLNAGHSAQAPAMFVEAAVSDGVKAMEDFQ